jgi:hypothetical protein
MMENRLFSGHAASRDGNNRSSSPPSFWLPENQRNHTTTQNPLTPSTTKTVCASQDRGRAKPLPLTKTTTSPPREIPLPLRGRSRPLHLTFSPTLPPSLPPSPGATNRPDIIDPALMRPRRLTSSSTSPCQTTRAGTPSFPPSLPPSLFSSLPPSLPPALPARPDPDAPRASGPAHLLPEYESKYALPSPVPPSLPLSLLLSFLPSALRLKKMQCIKTLTHTPSFPPSFPPPRLGGLKVTLRKSPVFKQGRTSTSSTSLPR